MCLWCNKIDLFCVTALWPDAALNINVHDKIHSSFEYWILIGQTAATQHVVRGSNGRILIKCFVVNCRGLYKVAV